MNQLATIIKKAEPKFTQIAKSKQVVFEEEAGFAFQLISGNQFMEKAVSESPESFERAIVNIAAIGLTLNPAEKLAYLIPRNVKEGNQWKTKVFLEPSYMGLIRLATNSGSIQWAQAAPVYEQDEFIDNGPGEKPTHKYNAFSKDRGDFVGVYCTAKTKEGDYLTTLMDNEKVCDLRDRSEAWRAYKEGKRKSGGPWQTDFVEMAKKAVIRQASKTWPKTNLALKTAIELSNQNEGFEPIVTSPYINNFTGEQKEYFDQCLENNDGWGLYKFKRSLVGGDATSQGASIWTSLTNSFERGQKGKYGQLLAELIKQGEKHLESTRNALIEARNDESAIEEIVIESDDEELALYIEGLDYELVQIIDEVREKFRG